MRWYTAGVALVTGISVSVAIEMREVADQAQRDRAHAAAARTYVATADKHAKETAVAIRKLTKQYAVALTTANRTQARMLADLRKARKAARLAQTISMAPVVYSTFLLRSRRCLGSCGERADDRDELTGGRGMATLKGKAAAVVCAAGFGAAVAGAAVAYSQSRTAPSNGGQGGAAVAAAKAAPASTAGAVTGLGTFDPATIPSPLHLKPVVVHPRKIVIKQGGAKTSASSSASKAASSSPWKKDQSGGGAGDGTPAPPPPPPPTGPAKTPTPPPPPPPGGGGGGTSTGSGGGGGGGTTSSAPRSTGRPRISGGNTAGSTLTVTKGTWSGATPMNFSYSWVRCGNGGGCTSVGSDSASYHTTSADVGFSFRCTVTATNNQGHASATSDTSDTIERGG